YPFALVILQLIAATVVIFLHGMCHAEKITDVFKPNPEGNTLLFLKLAFMSWCLAFFFPLWIQSTLHFENIATLLMILPIISFFDIIPLGPWYKVGLCVTLTLSCLTILLDDYKIAPNGWLFGIPAILILGVIHAILRDQPTNGSGLQSPDEDQRISPLVMLLPFFSCLFFFEDDHEVVLTWAQVPMLCLNLITTAVAITLWPETHKQTKNNLSQSIVFFALPAFAALFSQQLELPAYLSYVQILAFLVVICCCAFTAFNNPGPTPAVEEEWLELPKHPEDDPKYADPFVSDLEDSKSESRARWKLRWDLYSTILLAAGIAVWIYFLINNFSTPFKQHTSHELRLDTGYKATSNIDIVISMYHEPPSHITHTSSLLKAIPAIGSKSPRLILYTKDPLADTTELQHLTNATKVIQLPNRLRLSFFKRPSTTHDSFLQESRITTLLKQEC
ncbi:hypothetical protein KCU75_g10673, partial [Aureobasidium melanogenum]